MTTVGAETDFCEAGLRRVPLFNVAKQDEPIQSPARAWSYQEHRAVARNASLERCIHFWGTDSVESVGIFSAHKAQQFRQVRLHRVPNRLLFTAVMRVCIRFHIDPLYAKRDDRTVRRTVSYGQG